MSKRIPRGIRNHNPGNIEHSTSKWQGLAAVQTDGRFATFRSPEYGIRAIARVLITYYKKHELDTVAGIINRWAPPVENNTRAYIEHVANRIGVGIDDPIDVTDPYIMYHLIEAIIKHENGSQPYDRRTIEHAMLLAGIVTEQPLEGSRTIKGGKIAGGATVGAAGFGALEQLESAQTALSGLTPYLEAAQWALMGVTLLGVGLMVFARIDDAKKGIR